jgi:epoxyqueuosine reductase
MGQVGDQAASALMSPDPESLRSDLLGLGFDAVRFTSLPAEVPGGAALGDWLDAGHHAEMAWLERSRQKRLDPQRVLPGAKSMILLGVNYGGADPGAGGPIWARYALHRDYHDTIEPALRRAGELIETWGGLGSRDYRYYVDTGPILERSWAARAGLGFIGKNAMLISREYGNWLFLSAILLKHDLPADPPISRLSQVKPVGTLCGNCTACSDACPTDAIPRPGVVDARKCISYLTIEHKGVIPREWRSAIGSRIYGCDICAEVCPWNRFAQQARTGLLEARPQLSALSLAELLQLTPETFATIFKGTAIKRLKLRGMLRNACVVAGNIGTSDLLPLLLRLASHPEPIVRAHAVWAVRKLAGDLALADARKVEQDPVVLSEYDGPI